MDLKDRLALYRLQYIEKIRNRPKGISVIDACKGIGVSFPTYYKWLRRLNSGGNRMDSLYDRRPIGERHYKSLRPEQENAIIEVIARNPEYGSQRISDALPKREDGKPLVSNGGVQNFLERRGLNHKKARIEFAKEYLGTMKELSIENNNEKKERSALFINNENENSLAGAI